MLPYIPTAPAKPPPAFESSVLSWLTIPVFEATDIPAPSTKAVAIIKIADFGSSLNVSHIAKGEKAVKNSWPLECLRSGSLGPSCVVRDSICRHRLRTPRLKSNPKRRRF